jgi:hypothetical protein
LVKKFIRAVGPTAPRQHGDRINGEPKVILISPQGILRHQPIRKQFHFYGGIYGLIKLGFHGAASTPFNHTINVITAQTTYLSNRQTLVSLRSQQMTASVQLLENLGGGWEESLLPSGAQNESKEVVSISRAPQSYRLAPVGATSLKGGRNDAAESNEVPWKLTTLRRSVERSTTG